jgi:hypothetical protein
MSEPIATVVFCDDVRHEVNGKVSIIGLYRGYLGLANVVPSLPKLVVFVMIDLPLSFEGQKVKVRVCDRNEDLVAGEAEARADNLPSRPAPEGVDDCIRMSIPIEMIGFVPVNGMRIWVEVECGDFSFRSQSLAIVIANQVPPGAKA